MKDYFAKIDKYNAEFAEAIMGKFRNLRYGITPCHKEHDFERIVMRKELADWQSNHDHGALSERVNINYLTWLPVRMEQDELEGGAGYCYNERTSPNGASLQYQHGNTTQNIIEVNAGGCITRINVNPEININDNTGARSFHISPAQAVWYFIHGLGFNPNVTTTDENGQEILGILQYIDINTIQITFSQPVAGWAYLS
jgi:hypothetical protein